MSKHGRIDTVTASGVFHHIRRIPFYREFWRHSIITAVIAQDLALRQRSRVSRDEMFLAGILHEIGRPVLFISEQER